MFAVHKAIKEFANSDESYLWNDTDNPVRFSPRPAGTEGFWVYYSLIDGAMEEEFDEDAPVSFNQLTLEVVVEGTFLDAIANVRDAVSTVRRTTPNPSLNYFQFGSLDYLVRLIDYLGPIMLAVNGITFGSDETDFETRAEITVNITNEWDGEIVTVEDLV